MTSQLPDFSVASAEVVDGTHVRIYFTCPVENNSNNCNPDNFLFSGSYLLMPVSAIAKNDYIDVKVNEMKAGIAHTVTVSGVEDILTRRLQDPKYAIFTGAGDPPEISSVVGIDSRTLRITFSESMKNDAELRSIANYTFRYSNYYFDKETSLVTVAVTVVDAYSVDLATSPMEALTGYEIRITNVSDALDNVISARSGRKQFISSNRPKLLEAVALRNPLRVRLSFDRDLISSAINLDKDNFTFTGPEYFSVHGVAFNGAYALELYYPNAIENGEYVVTVSTAIDPQARNIDPYYNAASFLGISSYASLNLDSALQTKTDKVRATFDQAVETGAELFNTANFVITGSNVVTVEEVVINTPERVYLIVSGLIYGATYTLRVYNLRSVFGMPLARYSTTFITNQIAPQLVSATAIDPTHIDIIYSEAMKDDVELTKVANYVTIYRASEFAWDYNITTYLNQILITLSRDMFVNAKLTDPANYIITHVPFGVVVDYTLVQTGASELTLTFNNTMETNYAFINPANYAITHIPFGTPVDYTLIETGNNELTLTFDNDMEPNIALITAANYVVEQPPEVSSAVFFLDTSTVDIVFDKDMANNAALIDASNYVITGPVSPTINDPLTRINATKVRLTTTAPLPPGSYTVTVATMGITDLGGSPVNSAFNTATFS